MIRFVGIVLFLIVYFAVGILAFAVLWVIERFNKPLKDIIALRIVQGAFKFILKFIAGVKTTVIGLENIPKDEAVLFVGNHRSMFDIVIAYSYMPRLTGFVAKKEINKVPFLRDWMRALYCLFLDRENMKEGLKTILLGIDYIKRGISIAIFPEGTRSKDEDMLEFKEGSLKFAEKTGCKIIPMVQNNTRSAFENQFPRVKRTHTVLEFGTPIDIKELSKEDRKFLGAYTRNVIKEIYDKNQALV